MDRSKYIDKYSDILKTEQFTIFKHDTTKSTENKIQRELKKLKSKISTTKVLAVVSNSLIPR